MATTIDATTFGNMRYDPPIQSDEHAAFCLLEAASRYEGKIIRDECGMLLVRDTNKVIHTDDMLRTVSMYVMDAAKPKATLKRVRAIMPVLVKQFGPMKPFLPPTQQEKAMATIDATAFGNMRYDTPIHSDEHAAFCLIEAARRYEGKIVQNEHGMLIVVDTNKYPHTDTRLRAVSLYAEDPKTLKRVKSVMVQMVKQFGPVPPLSREERRMFIRPELLRYVETAKTREIAQQERDNPETACPVCGTEPEPAVCRDCGVEI